MNLEKNFLVVGCGGLGCSIVENLLRLGVKSVAVCDGDTFDESNLNRQIYAVKKTLGTSKVVAAKKRAKKIGYKGEFIAYNEIFDELTADRMLDGVDIVIDALDNIESRLILEDECEKRGLPIVHGAVNEWIYQVAVVMPGSRLLHKLFDGKAKGDSNVNYSFVVATCAAKEVAEAMLLAEGEESTLQNRVCIFDMKENFLQVFDL